MPLALNDPVSQTGEIDIIEGVHDNEHNQVAWHTGPGVLFLGQTSKATVNLE
jgi:hypothetical protein